MSIDLLAHLRAVEYAAVADDRARGAATLARGAVVVEQIGIHWCVERPQRQLNDYEGKSKTPDLS